MKTDRFRPLAAVALFCASSVFCSAIIYKDIDMESASVNSSSWTLTDNYNGTNYNYSAIRKGTTDVPKEITGSGNFYKGASGLKFGMSRRRE
jgi:hypothetical protein